MGRSESQTILREQILRAGIYEEPKGDLEPRIARLFADVLGVDRAGANDDFFELGGDSLSAEALATAISHVTNQNFEIGLLIKYSTPRSVTRFLEKSTVTIAEKSSRPIFMVHGLRGFVFPRPEFLSELAAGQKLYMFELPGIRGNGEPLDRISDIAAHYVKQVEQEQPEGSVLLGAYCGGAIIALEMARILADKGRPLRHIVLFDPAGIPPNVMDNFLRHKIGTCGTGVRRRERLDPHWGWIGLQGLKLWHLWHLGRWTDGSKDKDLSDDRLRALHEQVYSERFRSSRRFKRSRRAAKISPARMKVALSKNVQVKFRAALHHFMPPAFQGTTTVFSSAEFQWRFQEPTSIWVSLLPNREVHVIGESHDDVIAVSGPTNAKLLQTAFDGSAQPILTKGELAPHTA